MSKFVLTVIFFRRKNIFVTKTKICNFWSKIKINYLQLN